MAAPYHIRRIGKRPIDAEGLNALALRYVERYATSREKLLRYLRRKLLEREWVGDAPADAEALADRMVALRYVDDRQFAEARTRSLSRRGYGARRIAHALTGDGIDETTRREVVAEADALDAAIAFARRKRLGPFGKGESDFEQQRRAVDLMLRAGHSLEIARRVARAATLDALLDGIDS